MSHENCWVARSAGLMGSTIMTMSSVRETDAIVSAVGPRATSNWHLVARRFAALREHSFDAAGGKFEVVRQPIEIDRMPTAAERPELARKGNACEIAQAGVFEEQPEQIEMQQVGKFDGKPHRAIGRARLKSKHEAPEAVRFYRHG